MWVFKGAESILAQPLLLFVFPLEDFVGGVDWMKRGMEIKFKIFIGGENLMRMDSRISNLRTNVALTWISIFIWLRKLRDLNSHGDTTFTISRCGHWGIFYVKLHKIGTEIKFWCPHFVENIFHSSPSTNSTGNNLCAFLRCRLSHNNISIRTSAFYESLFSICIFLCDSGSIAGGSGREEEKCRNQFHHFSRVCSCLLPPSFLLSHSLFRCALFIGNHSLIIYHWKNTQRIFFRAGGRERIFSCVCGEEIEDNFMPYPSLLRKIFAEFNQR